MCNKTIVAILSGEVMVPIIENFLWHLVDRRKHQLMPVDKAGRFLLANPNQWSLDRLANQACLSQRQFYRQFVTSEGVSPKLYARIACFENAMKIKNTALRKDWFSVAIDLGYYDYQYLVRDFKAFTSRTPTAVYLLTDEFHNILKKRCRLVALERVEPGLTTAFLVSGNFLMPVLWRMRSSRISTITVSAPDVCGCYPL